MISTAPFMASAILFVAVAVIASVVGYRLTCGRKADAQPGPPLPPINGVSLPPPPPVTVAAPPRRPNAWAIYDEPTARKAARQGMWAAFFVAIATAAVSLLAGSGISILRGVGPTAWVDALVFGALGLGIGRMSRLAAIGALALYIVERIAMAPTAGLSPVMMVAMISAFAQGIRGTFAWHKYHQESPDPMQMVQPYS
ncbi:MAG TPA: hypothetical protein VFA04_05800 [Bryobacteraceae bacterium]|nr:hypothetical protein [Bryobacteraceae bacterium]